MSTRESNVLFLNRAKPEVAVSLLNRNLDSLWKKTLGNLLSPVVSPSWATPILLHDKVCRQFISINACGSAEQHQTIEIPGLARELEKNHFNHPRFAIGQSTEGDWLLIAY